MKRPGPPPPTQRKLTNPTVPPPNIVKMPSLPNRTTRPDQNSALDQSISRESDKSNQVKPELSSLEQELQRLKEERMKLQDSQMDFDSDPDDQQQGTSSDPEFIPSDGKLEMKQEINVEHHVTEEVQKQLTKKTQENAEQIGEETEKEQQKEIFKVKPPEPPRKLPSVRPTPPPIRPNEDKQTQPVQISQQKPTQETIPPPKQFPLEPSAPIEPIKAPPKHPPLDQPILSDQTAAYNSLQQTVVSLQLRYRQLLKQSESSLNKLQSAEQSYIDRIKSLKHTLQDQDFQIRSLLQEL